jgi:dihydrofolate synthase/folylpolyglutamate synthase
VISQRQEETTEVFKHKAELEDTSLCFAEDFYKVSWKNNTPFDGFTAYWNNNHFFDTDHFGLGGLYQHWNIQGVLMTAELLNEQGFVLPIDSIKHGIEQVIFNTGLRGRWQRLQENPTVICDTGHNKDGIEQVVAQLNTLPYKTLHIVIGMVREKDALSVLKLLPADATYYFCQASIPRAEEAHILAEKALSLGLKGEVIPDVNEAIAAAKRSAAKDDLIFIGGSTFVVAEINEL